MRKGIVYCLITVLLLGLLAGCDEPVDTHAPKGGTLYLNANSVIAVTYDEQGKVTSVTAGSENAKDIVDSYGDFTGKSCSEVVAELVKKVGEAGHLNGETAIEVTFDEDAGVPESDFAETLEQEIRDTVEENQWQSTVKVEAPVSSTTSTQTGNQGGAEEKPNVPEGAEKQADGTYILKEYLDGDYNVVSSESAAWFLRTCIYDADGIQLTEEQKELQSGQVRLYREYYPNGYRKTDKLWRADGTMRQEFVSFHDGDDRNGIQTFYDEKGNMESRFTEGNPDGSPATSEVWYEEDGGTYVMSIYDAPYMATLDGYGNIISEAQMVESRYKLGDGTWHNHTFDYVLETHHVIGYWVSSNSTQDLTRCMVTDAPIEGYIESTIDGIYSRQEWKNRQKVLQITDGGNYMGYKVKDTTYFYPNGNVKSFERYFYIDGGRYYAEYDINGNETFLEITTAYY